MATIRDSLQAINGYPVPQLTLEVIAAERGIDLEMDVTPESVRATAYRGAKADILRWLANAPSVSQGGQSYNLSEAQKKRFLAEANGIYDELGEEAYKASVVYGYKGSRL